MLYYDHQHRMEVEMNKQIGSEQQEGLLLNSFLNGDYFYYKALEAFRSQNLTKARRYLERAVKLKPNSVEYTSQLAIVLAELEDFPLSNQWFKHILENIDPSMSECSFFMANNYAHLGLFDHAKKEILRYLKADQEGEFVEEAEELLELLEEDESLTETLFDDEEQFLLTFELASQEFKKREYRKTIELLLPLIEKQPTYWSAQLRLAEAYYHIGEKTKAVSQLENILDIDTNHLPALCHMMVYLYDLKNYERSDAIFQMVKDIKPFDIDQTYLLAVSLGKIGQHERTYGLLAKLSKQGYGDFPEFYHHYAVASFYTNRLNQARLLWKKLSGFDPEFSKKYCELFDHARLTNVTYEYTIPND